jgi:NhaA family Na+:H+ antiporter
MNFLEEFVKKESSAGCLLIFVTALALLLNNLALSEIYNVFLHTGMLLAGIQ